jgi:hypothetical protein
MLWRPNAALICKANQYNTHLSLLISTISSRLHQDGLVRRNARILAWHMFLDSRGCMANSASDCDVSIHKIMSRNDCSARSANDVPLVYIASQETSTKLVN